MPCFRPLKATRSTNRFTDTGKGVLTFHKVWPPYAPDPIELPCGQCIGCRLERSRQWAIRCVHEASLHENNCFITLTYDQANLPDPPSLKFRHFQLFMKKLRKKYGSGIRFYHCGEYGEKMGRPHYHACLFNHDFEDKKLWQMRDDIPLFTSESLSGLWSLGFCSVGAVTFQSAAYVARYILKKMTGKTAEAQYAWTCPKTGQVHQRCPEYTTMSRRPGIGQGWLEKYSSDIYPRDQVILNGVPMKPPKYYDKQFEIADPEKYIDVRETRVRKARAHAENNTRERLEVRENVQTARLKQLKRGLK